ncbi:MAG: mechanosensitive ion channel family protein, partial [Nannocystaceae bacterium]
MQLAFTLASTLASTEESVLTRLVESLQGWINGFIDLLPNLVLAVVVVVAFGFASRYVQKMVCRIVGRMTKRNSISGLFANIAKLATVVVGIFIALGLLHLDKTVTSLLAGVGVVGLALGFAFQDIAANFVSGVLMVFRRPFADGDLVEIGGETGHVQKIELRATHLTTFDGLTVTLPNKEVFQNKIINYTRTNRRRVSFDVGVAYSDDLRVA